MAVSIREITTEGVHLTDSAKAALQGYANLVWEVPEVRLVYGYMEDGWLVSVTVGAKIEDEARHRVYQIQRQMRARFPEFDWGFRLTDQGTLPYQIPDFSPDEVFIITRPRVK